MPFPPQDPQKGTTQMPQGEIFWFRLSCWWKWVVAFFCLLGVLGNFAGGGVAGFLGGFGVFFFARPLQDACFCLLSHNVNDENSYVQLNIGKEPLRATTSWITRTVWSGDAGQRLQTDVFCTKSIASTVMVWGRPKRLLQGPFPAGSFWALFPRLIYSYLLHLGGSWMLSTKHTSVSFRN